MKKLTFDINNLLCKKEVVLSKEEITEIVRFAIENKIVKVEIQMIDTVENIIIKQFEDDECSSCHGVGEYEVSAGNHSFFKDCHCKEKIC